MLGIWVKLETDSFLVLRRGRKKLFIRPRCNSSALRPGVELNWTSNISNYIFNHAVVVNAES